MIAENNIVAGIKNNQIKRLIVKKVLPVNKIGFNKIIDPCVSMFFVISKASAMKSIESKRRNIIGVLKSSSPVNFFKLNSFFTDNVVARGRRA